MYPGSITSLHHRFFLLEGIDQVLPVLSAMPQRARTSQFGHLPLISCKLARSVSVLCMVTRRTARIRMFPLPNQLDSEPTVLSHSYHL